MKNIFLIFLKLAAIFLALYLSTLVLSKKTIPLGEPGISCAPTEEYSGRRGLPLPFDYTGTDNGGYKYSIVIFTVDYLFWIGFFMISHEFIIKGRFALGKWKVKMMLNDNILYLVFSFVFYIFYLLYVNQFLAQGGVC